MNSAKNRTSRIFQILPFALLFLGGSFYLFYYTSYLFFYQEKSSLFLVSFSYLQEHLKQPGGLLSYLGELQTAFYFYPIIGSILVPLEICGSVFLLQKIGRALTGKRFYLLPFLIGAALFYLQINYQYQAFNNLGILIQLILYYGVITFPRKEFLWIPVVLTPVVYLLFGSFSVVFLLLLSIYFLQKKEWIKLATTWVLCGLFFFIGKEFLFFRTTETLLKYPFLVKDIGHQLNLFVVVLGTIVLLPLLIRIELKRIASISIKKNRLVELTPFVIIVVLFVLLLPRIDKKNKNYFYVEKLFYEQKYQELIQFNTQFPTTNLLTAFLNNVALAETGQLTESFFSFRQTSDGTTLFLKWEIISEVLKRGGHFYSAIGMINEAQRWAYEYMVMQGNSPEAIKMMIKTDLIKGKYKVAEKYISILEKSIFYRNDAREFRNLLENDSAVATHRELGKKQKLDIKQDFFVQADNPPANLDLIIEADSTNIPAIEYKLAWLMLQKDMKGIVDLLPVMEKAGYTRIPKNVEEAVVSYNLLKVGKMPELKNLEVNGATEKRFQQFYQIFQQNQNNKQQAERALARDFFDTYWYYVFFN